MKNIVLLVVAFLSFNVSASSYYWVSSTEKIEVKDLGFNSTVQFKLERIHEYTDTYVVYEDNFVTEIKRINRSCENFICFGEQEAAPLWDDYASEFEENKASALARAITGLKKSSAQKLINAGYFKFKPMSWLEFKQDMDEALSSRFISKVEHSDVMFTHARRNLRQMGYDVRGCSVEKYSCTLEIEEKVNKPIPVTKTKLVKNVVETRGVNMDVVLENPLLLPHEKEVFEIKLDPNLNTVVVKQVTQFANYKTVLSSDLKRLDIIPLNRNLKDLSPNHILNQVLKIENGKPFLYVQVSPDILQGVSDQDVLLLTYQVKYCVPGWTGWCGMFESWSFLEPQTVNVNQNTLRLPINFMNLKGELRIEIDIYFQRPNSKWYNPKPTRPATTNIINVEI